MPIQFPDIQRISFAEANPWLSGMEAGQDLTQKMMMLPQDYRAKQLANAIAQVQAQYAAPKAQQELIAAQQQNQWNPKIWQSNIGLQGAEAGNYAAEAAKTNFLLKHPGLMGGDEAKNIESLRLMGLIPNGMQGNQSAGQSGGAQTALPAQSASQPGGVMQQSPSDAMGQQGVAPQQQAQGIGSAPPSAISAALTTSVPSLTTSNPAAAENMHPFNTGNPTVDALLNNKFASSAYQQKMAIGFDWVHSPIDAKNYEIAQLAGAGVDPSEAVHLRSAGYTVPQILQSKGFDPNNPPPPDYLPTHGNVTQLNQRKASMKAVDTLGTFVREGLGPYSQTIMGYSPAQISGALSGKNEDEQAKFLAARAIVPELTNMRLAASGGKVTVHAIESMQDSSLNQIKTLRASVTPKVWMKTQKLIDEQINKAMNASNDAYTVNTGSSKKSAPDSNAIVWTKDASGKYVREQ